MRLPRDISGERLAAALKKLGYSSTRQSGSHMRLTTFEGGEHHITIPIHKELRLGTLIAILNDIAEHHKICRDEVVELLFHH